MEAAVGIIVHPHDSCVIASVDTEYESGGRADIDACERLVQQEGVCCTGCIVVITDDMSIPVDSNALCRCSAGIVDRRVRSVVEQESVKHAAGVHVSSYDL